MVDKVEAVRMRKQGMNYKDIANSLSCSESWCKVNLKGVFQEFSTSDDELSMKRQAITILEDALTKLRSLG